MCDLVTVNQTGQQDLIVILVVVVLMIIIILYLRVHYENKHYLVVGRYYAVMLTGDSRNCSSVRKLGFLRIGLSAQ